MPKISQDRIPQRFVDRRRPQRAEQLVEVPTVVSHSSLKQQSDEQTLDIPVPGREGSGSGGLRGFHPRQGSLQRTVEQIVDIRQLLPQFRVKSWRMGGVFRTYPRSKKSAEVAGRWVRGCTGTRAHPR